MAPTSVMSVLKFVSEIIEEEFEYEERNRFSDINLLTPEEIKAFFG